MGSNTGNASPIDAACTSISAFNCTRPPASRPVRSTWARYAPKAPTRKTRQGLAIREAAEQTGPVAEQTAALWIGQHALEEAFVVGTVEGEKDLQRLLGLFRVVEQGAQGAHGAQPFDRAFGRRRWNIEPCRALDCISARYRVHRAPPLFVVRAA
jgi:hypothetical protein